MIHLIKTTKGNVMTKIEKELWDKWTDQAQLFIIHNEDLEQDTKAETNIIEYNEAA